MKRGDIIDINGVWTSKDGRNKVHIIQSLDKFEGYVGSPEVVKISLGTVSKQTLNFKQTWLDGVNKGAVATVYGKLSCDGGTIILDFEGMRANGRAIKGWNAIFRESIVGTWVPKGISGSGEVWRFMLGLNNWDITGYFLQSKINERVEFKGQRYWSNENCFLILLPTYEKDGMVEIPGEYKCPNIVLALPPNLGNKSIVLERKPVEFPPKFEEYEPVPRLQKDSSTTSMKSVSLSSQKEPFRGESEVVYTTSSQLDLRTALLVPTDVPSNKNHTFSQCCCCTVL